MLEQTKTEVISPLWANLNRRLNIVGKLIFKQRLKDAKIILFCESMGAASVLLAGSYVYLKNLLG